MRITSFVRAALPGALSLALATAVPAQVVVSVSVGAPPALPVYEQPPVPASGYVWTPGYWGYDPNDGYFWVPGTWVQAPEPGYSGPRAIGAGATTAMRGILATGAPQVGFYGGINYGYGYGGVGYQGGHWDNGAFYYNRSVTRVSNTTNITNVYNKTVVNNTTVTNVSYNGGAGGTPARPTPAELAVSHERHVPPTADQTQHEHTASTNHAQWASVNHGKPAVVATPKPGEFAGKDVVTTSRETRAYRATSTGDVTTRTHPAAPHPKVAAPPSTQKAPVTDAHPDVKDHSKGQGQSKLDQSKPKGQPKASDEHKAEGQPKASAPPKQQHPPASDEKPKADDKPKTGDKPPEST